MVPPERHFTKVSMKFIVNITELSWEGNINGGEGLTNDFEDLGSKFLS